MRRRALLSATAAALTAPLVAGCSRDDGGGDGEDGDGDGGGNGGGGGPYGMVGADDTVLAAPSDGGSSGGSEGRSTEPVLGVETHGDPDELVGPGAPDLVG